jgi:hypothetical protein
VTVLVVSGRDVAVVMAGFAVSVSVTVTGQRDDGATGEQRSNESRHDSDDLQVKLLSW